MAMISCKECGKEISSDAEVCPSCGVTVKKKTSIIGSIFKWLFGTFVVLMVIGFLADETGDDPLTSVSESAAAFLVGDSIQTEKLEIQVKSVKIKNRVGSEYFNSTPSQGGVYVAVTWNYKNISSQPIGSFSTPSLNLVDPNGVKYDADIGATSSYATQLNLDSKIFSDLNPGIRVVDAQVFEVSQQLFDKKTWKLLIDADQRIVVNIQ